MQLNLQKPRTAFSFVFIFLILVTFQGCNLITEPEDEFKDPIEEEIKPTEIKFQAQTLTLLIGDSSQLTYQVIPDTIKITDLTWSSSNDTVATVSQNGVIKTKSLGQTLIKARSEKEKAEANILLTVIPIALNKISFEGSILPAYIGEPTKVKVTYEPENATDKKLRWHSSDNLIVSVDSTGTVTAKKHGYVWISADQNDHAYTSAVIVPANKGQLVAASQINTRTHEQKDYIRVFICALQSHVDVKAVTLYMKNRNDPESYEVKTVNPSLSINAGNAKEVAIEVSAEQANELTFGRYVRIELTAGEKDYYVYLSWFNDIEITEK